LTVMVREGFALISGRSCRRQVRSVRWL